MVDRDQQRADADRVGEGAAHDNSADGDCEKRGALNLYVGGRRVFQGMDPFGLVFRCTNPKVLRRICLMGSMNSRDRRRARNESNVHRSNRI